MWFGWFSFSGFCWFDGLLGVLADFVCLGVDSLGFGLFA